MQDRKALVLGGTGDIGAAITCSLQDQFGDSVIAVGATDIDLGSNKSIQSFLERHGRDFDVLVHSAGINKPDLFENLTVGQIEKSIQVNLLGFLSLVHECIPYWKTKKSGRVVIVSSLYGFLSRRGRLAYAVSKHALIGAMKTLAIEFAEYGVLVNSVSPGYIDTRMTRQNNTLEQIEKLQSGIPINKMGSPEDVADAVSFLVSERNKYITGHDLVVDGGYSIGGFQG